MDRAAYLILPALVLLPACDLPKTWTEAQLREIAAEEANSRVRSVAMTVDSNAGVGNEQGERIEELESRVRRLENELSVVRSELERVSIDAHGH